MDYSRSYVVAERLAYGFQKVAFFPPQVSSKTQGLTERNPLNLSVAPFSSKICIEQFKLVKANASREAYRASRERNQIFACGRSGC